MNKRKTLNRLIIALVICLLFVGFVSWFFDIFYQYHMPFFGMDAIYFDRDNQMPGSVRNEKYDAALIGSSVAENFNPEYLDSVYGTKTIKIIKTYGHYVDHKYYYEMARRTHNLKKVYWCLDLWALNSPDDVSIFDDGASKYLHSSTVLDDIPYLYNKDIILKKIPEWCLYQKQHKYIGGDAYAWGDEMTFSKDLVLASYDRTGYDLNNIQEKDPKEYTAIIDAKAEDMRKLIQEAPETEFVFIFPPYSMCWWDAQYISGHYHEQMYSLQKFMEEVLPLENVKAYYFQADCDVICNLDNYMDLVHYTPEINQMMLAAVVNGENEIHPGGYDQIEKNMMELIDVIETEEIPKYFEE